MALSKSIIIITIIIYYSINHIGFFSGDATYSDYPCITASALYLWHWPR